jgi:hypothetical protein
MQRTPEDTLRRVLKVSRINGWSVAAAAGLSGLVALALGDLVGVGVSLLVTLGGVLEVRGHRQLRRRDADGMGSLVRAQWVVLGAIWAYAVSRLASFDETIAREMATPDMQTLLNEMGLTLNDLMPLVRRVFYVLYGSVMAVTLFYQGGLALYYRRRTAAVIQAFQAPPIVPSAAAAPAPLPGDYSI